MADKDIDLKKIKELIDIMKQNGLEEIEIKHGDNAIHLKRNQPQPLSGPIITSMPMMKHDMMPYAGQANLAGVSGPSAPVDDNLIAIKSP